MNKAILILSDGLRYDTAVSYMGYLVHLIETHQASLYRCIAELPTLSRPAYECIHTGLPCSQHGIVSNQIVRPSSCANLFSIATQTGKTTAAAAYSWFSELYNRTPYNPVQDREVDDPSLSIQHGRFYLQEDFPDAEVFASAAFLVQRFQPDYLLVHPMGMDYTGENAGIKSSHYPKQAILQDSLLAYCIPGWREAGYTIIFTADHGMCPDGFHGGTTADVREVPFVIIPPNHRVPGDTGQTISQLQIAPTLCSILDLPIPKEMEHSPVSVN